MGVDKFSHTHVETVVQLSKGNISSQNVRVEFSLEDMDMSRIPAGRCIRTYPGVGTGEVRFPCDTLEYRPGKTEVWNHRTGEL